MIKYLDKDFEKEIKNKRILLDFYASWCGPCKMLTEVLEEMEPQLKIDVLKIDVDKFPEVARKYNVLSIPTLYLLDNEKVIKNHVGYLNQEDLLNFINK